MYQFHQRASAAIFQSLHVHPRAGRVRTRGHTVDVHRLRSRSATNNRPDREGSNAAAALASNKTRTSERAAFVPGVQFSHVD